MFTDPLAAMGNNEKIIEGRKRILECLANKVAEKEEEGTTGDGLLVSVLELQNQYFKEYQRQLNKDENRLLFNKKQFQHILKEYMAKDIEMSTDMDKSGSLYMRLLRPVEVALADPPVKSSRIIKVRSLSATNGRQIGRHDGIERTNTTKPTTIPFSLGARSKAPAKVGGNGTIGGKGGRPLGKQNTAILSNNGSSDDEDDDDLAYSVDHEQEEYGEKFRQNKISRANNAEEDDEKCDEEDSDIACSDILLSNGIECPPIPELLHSELLANIFVIVRMKNTVKVEDFHNEIARFHPPYSAMFKTSACLIQFVKRHCGNIISVQKVNTEPFFCWNEQQPNMPNNVSYLVRKLGKSLKSKLKMDEEGER